MKTFTRTIVPALLAILSVTSLHSMSVVASPPQKLLLNPGEPNGPDFPMPKFGFSSFNINGVGERVTHVKWNGRAAQLGLEPGDIILSMNGYPLSYPGSWRDALYEAVLNGGWVRLTIRDVRTGFIASRQTFVGFGGNVPILQNYSAGYPMDPHDAHVHHHNHGGGLNLKEIVKLIDNLSD
jgi:hypothetical protein